MGQCKIYQVGYTSSHSDHSPSSSNSDGQDRTGRIIFKLFVKDPNSFPGALKSQAGIEGYHSVHLAGYLFALANERKDDITDTKLALKQSIGNGKLHPTRLCGSINLCLHAIYGAWDDVERNLTLGVSSLVQCSESDFWRSGRFLVQTNRQPASHKDGKIHMCKSWKTLSDPVLTSVSPITVVSGQETSFVLKGRNLTAPGTRIHCTYMGGYISMDVLGTACPGTIYDASSTESFSVYGESFNIHGRCFIEVENGFKGNSFPVIIADSMICQELRVLESDFEGGRPTVALHFLNELGWLFLIERDWTAIVRTLLDMLVERSLIGDDSLVQESLEMLFEIQLLSRAVKR